MHSNTSTMEHGVSILFFCWDLLKQIGKDCLEAIDVNKGRLQILVHQRKILSAKNIGR